MGCFRAWLAAVSFASFLESRIEQLVKWNHCFVGSVGRVGFLGAPNLLNPQMSLSVSMPWSVGLTGSLWLWQPTPVLEAARGQLNRPVYSPGMQVCCAVTNTRLHSAWQTVFFTALRSYSGSADSSLQIWCFPLSGDAVFNHAVSCRRNVAPSSLCTVQSNSFVGGWWIQAHCSWACQPGTEDGNLSNFCNFWEMGNFVDWRENLTAGLNKHQLCAGRLARKSLPPIYSWKSSQIFNTVLDFWVMNRECKENSMLTQFTPQIN